MDLDGVTAIGKINQVCLAGGVIEKLNQQTGVHQKLIFGDKFGSVHLMDISRKLILDKKALPKYEGRRILNIATACLEWIDTRLIYCAIVARGSPIVSIVCFKHNENKLYHLYSLNTCPELENPDQLELNEGQTYLMLPSEVKMSVDGEFLTVTSFDGSVKLIQMPPVFDPMNF